MDKLSEVDDYTLNINYKGKKYKFNIPQELQIDTNVINTLLKKSPSNYAFISLVRDRYIFERDSLQREKEKSYSEAWVYYKESGNINNDLAGHKATIHPKYQSICERYDKVNLKTNQLISLCKAFEARDKILQTLSANIRKQQ